MKEPRGWTDQRERRGGTHPEPPPPQKPSAPPESPPCPESSPSPVSSPEAIMSGTVSQAQILPRQPPQPNLSESNKPGEQEPCFPAAMYLPPRLHLPHQRSRPPPSPSLRRVPQWNYCIGSKPNDRTTRTDCSRHEKGDKKRDEGEGRTGDRGPWEGHK